MNINKHNGCNIRRLPWFLIGVVLVLVFGLQYIPKGIKPKQVTEKADDAEVLKLWQSDAMVQFKEPGEEAIFQSTLPLDEGPEGYVGSEDCMECHRDEHESWQHTYHKTMTQLMTADSVRADFNNVELEHNGELFKLTQEGEEFWVEITDRQPSLAGDAPASTPQGIKLRLGLVTGSHHMQVFWMPALHGNMQIGFPFTWLIEDRKWVPRDSTFVRDPHSISRPEIWNLSCIRCHATAATPGHDKDTDEMVSTAADLGISCEACHGPGETHIAWHRQREEAKETGVKLQDGRDPIIQPDELASDRSTQICGQCHGMKWWDEKEAWRQTGFDYRPGDDLTETTPIIQPTKIDELPWLQHIVEKNPSLLRDFFWSDGMMRVSGREYNGLLETPCHQLGDMSCVSCHSMHTSDPNDMLGKNMDGNQACLQCHESFEENIEVHTHHAAESEGSLCYNCHMPHTTFSLLSAIRSHQVDSPDASISHQTGRPNACNLCHTDQSLGWTAKKLNDWYEKPMPELDPLDQNLSFLLKHLLKGDAGQRALAAWHLGWESSMKVTGNEWQPRFLAELLDDPYAAVRYVAYKALKSFPDYESFEYDYVANQSLLEEAQKQAIDIWENKQDGKTGTGAENLLLMETGKVNLELLQTLLENRDDTPIRLRE